MGRCLSRGRGPMAKVCTCPEDVSARSSSRYGSPVQSASSHSPLVSSGNIPPAPNMSSSYVWISSSFCGRASASSFSAAGSCVHAIFALSAAVRLSVTSCSSVCAVVGVQSAGSLSGGQTVPGTVTSFMCGFRIRHENLDCANSFLYFSVHRSTSSLYCATSSFLGSSYELLAYTTPATTNATPHTAKRPIHNMLGPSSSGSS
mmetsp:Transcript_3342/g.7890  ORF Transcript_3342/g.7890 Transcript_3342/m.7890 type:complete len:203 (-) Transcript_3342:227-835(-)